MNDEPDKEDSVKPDIVSAQYKQAYMDGRKSLDTLLAAQSDQIRLLQEEVVKWKRTVVHVSDENKALESLLSSEKEKHGQIWDAALAALGKIHERHQGNKFMPKEQAKFIASLMERDLEKDKSTYLSSLTQTDVKTEKSK